MPEVKDTDSNSTQGEAGWYVVHSRTKAEHIAASMVESQLGIPTFCPRIRFLRATSRGKKAFVEALFPSYFFARFNPKELTRAVRHAHNVLGLVEFGGTLAEVPEEVIATLKEEMGHEEIHEIANPVQAGDAVEIGDGPMRGFRGIVHSITRGEDRVRVLLEFLGNENMVEVQSHQVVVDRPARAAFGDQQKDR